MSNNELKRCIVPGCGKELPRGTKIPVCDFHKGEAKEKAANAGKGAMGAAVLAVGFVKANGPALAKEYLPKVGKAVKALITKKL